jgi:hypothetical protein
VISIILWLMYPTVGALVAARRPHNPIGWIFCGIGLLTAAQSFAIAYGDYSLAVWDGALAGVMLMAWLSSWISDPVGLIGGALLCLLFPNGRLLSSRWRPVMWTAVGAGTTLLLIGAITPGPLLTFPSMSNPVGIGGEVDHILGLLGTISLVILLVACLARWFRCSFACAGLKGWSASSLSGSCTQLPYRPWVLLSPMRELTC